MHTHRRKQPVGMARTKRSRGRAHQAPRGGAAAPQAFAAPTDIADDIAGMARIVQEAIEAGALGFSTSRTEAHRAIDGEPVPGTYAAEDELFALLIDELICDFVCPRLGLLCNMA